MNLKDVTSEIRRGSFCILGTVKARVRVIGSTHLGNVLKT